MKKFFYLLVFTSLYASNSFAMHAVTKKFSGNKLLICKDFDQEIQGSKVKVKLKGDKKNSAVDKGAIVSEFALPSVGEKISIFHKEFHDTKSDKGQGKYHEMKMASATVIDVNLEGEKYSFTPSIKNKSDRPKAIEKMVTAEQALKFKNECIVALPDDNVEIKELSSVEF